MRRDSQAPAQPLTQTGVYQPLPPLQRQCDAITTTRSPHQPPSAPGRDMDWAPSHRRRLLLRTRQHLLLLSRNPNGTTHRSPQPCDQQTRLLPLLPRRRPEMGESHNGGNHPRIPLATPRKTTTRNPSAFVTAGPCRSAFLPPARSRSRRGGQPRWDRADNRVQG